MHLSAPLRRNPEVVVRLGLLFADLLRLGVHRTSGGVAVYRLFILQDIEYLGEVGGVHIWCLLALIPERCEVELAKADLRIPQGLVGLELGPTSRSLGLMWH